MGNGQKRTLVLGIDPGLSGALAYVTLEDAKTKPHLAHVYDFPLRLEAAKGERATPRRFIDPYKLGLLIDRYNPDTAFAVVEEVSAMPGQGVTSMFNFGKAMGQVIGCLGACLIPTYFVRPAVWKLRMGLSSDKTLSRNLASRLFPSHNSIWSRKKDDGRAEAVLLAYYGCLNYGAYHANRDRILEFQ